MKKKKIYPVRGVVYVVKNNTGVKDMISVDIDKEGESLYLMPRREGELIIGGCFQKNSETKYVDDGLKSRILGRCPEFLPEYNWTNIEIVREQVGFRPFREGGFRIERKGHIIHCYGVGGSGYQSSWGCADRVSKLASEIETTSKF